MLGLVAWRRSGFRRPSASSKRSGSPASRSRRSCSTSPSGSRSTGPRRSRRSSSWWTPRRAWRPATSRGGEPRPRRETRREAVEPLTLPESWQGLGEQDARRVPAVLAPQGRARDRPERPAEQGRPRRSPNLRGVVLASDGDWNEGSRRSCRGQAPGPGVPVFAVPVGSPTRLPDVELISLDAPTFGVAGKAVRVPFTIDSALPRDYVTTVTLRASDGDEITKEVRVEPMGRTTEVVTWKPKATGDYTVDPGGAPSTPTSRWPTTTASRRRSRSARRSSGSWWSSRPRAGSTATSATPSRATRGSRCRASCSTRAWASRRRQQGLHQGVPHGARRAVEVRRGVPRRRRGRGGPAHGRGLPAPQGAGRAPGERPGLHAGVRGPAVLAAGHRAGRPLPGDAGPAQPGGWGSRTPEPLRADRDGPAEPPDQAGRLAGRQRRGLGRVARVPVVRAGAPGQAGREVLCVHKDAGNESGRLPLLVTRTFGAGKVLFMGTDGAWRWRKGVEDKYHYRFWGQVVRWMAYQRNMAKGETMRLYYVPDQPKMNQTLTLHANVMEPRRRARPPGRRLGPDRPPSGKAESVRFGSDGEEWGTFTGRFDAAGAGQVRVTLTCKQTKADARSHAQRPGGRRRAARPPGPARGPRRDRPGLARQGRQGRRARRDRPVARRAPRAAALGPPGPALEPPRRGRRPARPARAVLGRAEVDRPDLIASANAVGSSQPGRPVAQRRTGRLTGRRCAMSLAEAAHGGCRSPRASGASSDDFRRRVWSIKMAEAVRRELRRRRGLPGDVRRRPAGRRPPAGPARPVRPRRPGLLAIPLAAYRWIWRQRGPDQLARLLARSSPRIGDQLLGVIELATSDSEQARSRRLVRGRHRAGGRATPASATSATPSPGPGTGPGPGRRRPPVRGRWACSSCPRGLHERPGPPGRALEVDPPLHLRRARAPARPPGRPPRRAVRDRGQADRPDRLAARQGPAGSATRPPSARRSPTAATPSTFPAQIAPGWVDVRVGDCRHRRPGRADAPARARRRHRAGSPARLPRPARGATKDVRGGSIALVKGAGPASRPPPAATSPAPPSTASPGSPPARPCSAPRPRSTPPDRWRSPGATCSAWPASRPFPLAVAAQDDEPPVLTVEDLPRQKVVLDSELLNFKVRAQDDFGVRRVGIEWKGSRTRRSSRPPQGERILGAGGPDKERSTSAGLLGQALGDRAAADRRPGVRRGLPARPRPGRTRRRTSSTSSRPRSTRSG